MKERKRVPFLRARASIASYSAYYLWWFCLGVLCLSVCHVPVPFQDQVR